MQDFHRPLFWLRCSFQANPRNPRVVSFTSPLHWLGVSVVSWVRRYVHLNSQTFGSFAYNHCVKPWSKRMEAMAMCFSDFPRHWSGFSEETGYVMICLGVQDPVLETSSVKTSSENLVSSRSWTSSWGQIIAREGRGNALAFECLGRQGDWPCDHVVYLSIYLYIYIYI